MMKKKAMLGNIIGGFIVILIGVSLVPIIQQEIDNAYNCGNIQTETVTTPYQEPIGTTDSFGGGGAGQFGGYDGKVHKSWASQYAIVKTNKSYLFNCASNQTGGLSETEKVMLDFIPIIFAIGIFGMGIMMAYNALRSAGLE